LELNNRTTQYPGLVTKETATVIIGLDFGTSSTKVVFQSPTLDNAYAIPFDTFGHETNRYLMPTRPYFALNGELMIDGLEKGIHLREIKRMIMTDKNDHFFDTSFELEADPMTLSIGYLAKVIQIARKWFLETNVQIFGGYKIDWLLNIGVPSIGKEFEKKKAIFRNIAILAWQNSIAEEKVTIENVRSTLNDLNNKELILQEINIENIDVIQEVVAETVGYSNSDSRVPGLHILIDVGAGTMDVSGFRLNNNKNEDSKYFVLTGNVEWCGGFELHRSRIKTTKEKVNTWLLDYGKYEDPIKPVPNSLDKYLPTVPDLKTNIDEIDTVKFQESYEAIYRVIHCLKVDKDPNAEEWDSGIRTFMCGGAIENEFYKKVIAEVNRTCKKNKMAGLNEHKLEKPGNLIADDNPENNYSRLAVAFGLSFRPEEIGEIKTPDEIKDVPKPEPPEDYTDHYMSHDT